MALVEFNKLELAKATPTHPAHDNLTKAERIALRELKGRHDIIIKPANKGSAVVIKNVKDYLDECHQQLANRKIYQPTAKDLTDSHKKIVFDSVKNMHLQVKIASKTFEYLTPTKPQEYWDHIRQTWSDHSEKMSFFRVCMHVHHCYTFFPKSTSQRDHAQGGLSFQQMNAPLNTFPLNTFRVCGSLPTAASPEDPVLCQGHCWYHTTKLKSPVSQLAPHQ